jgi:NADPH:quinone reductase-like Zn-dependent oxidoreductase
MKAISIRKFGGREVLEFLDLPKPTIKPNEILVRLKAAGVNPVDWKIRKGLLQGRLPHEFPIILGWDGAGVVEEVGSEVKNFKKGDEVFAYARKEIIHDGCYAEYIALEERHLAIKPKNLSFEEAAVIPLSGLTAYQSLFESLQLKKGEAILIHAGAGGVGGYAIQLAKQAGAHVITTASAGKRDYVKELGADEIIDYGRIDFVEAIRAAHPGGIDAVFDTVGGEVQEKSADVLKKGGRLTSILALNEGALRKKGVVPGYVFVRPESDHLHRLKEMAERGTLKVRIADRFPLNEAAQAHEIIEGGHVLGKIVLSISV